MTWQDAIGILSTLALFTPVLIIVVTKLIRYKQYFPLFIYCLLAFGFNLMTEHLVSVPKSIERFYGITNNLTDMPLMLGFLLFQISSSVQRKRIKILLGAFIVFEIVLIFDCILHCKEPAPGMPKEIKIVLIEPQRGTYLFYFFNKTWRCPQTAVCWLIRIKRTKLIVLDHFKTFTRKKTFKTFHVFMCHCRSAVK